MALLYSVNLFCKEKPYYDYAQKQSNTKHLFDCIKMFEVIGINNPFQMINYLNLSRLNNTEICSFSSMLLENGGKGRSQAWN